MGEPIPASDASTLTYLAEFPDVEPEDRERLLAPLSEESRKIAKILLGDESEATPELKQKADALRHWAAGSSAMR